MKGTVEDGLFGVPADFGPQRLELIVDLLRSQVPAAARPPTAALLHRNGLRGLRSKGQMDGQVKIAAPQP